MQTNPETKRSVVAKGWGTGNQIRKIGRNYQRVWVTFWADEQAHYLNCGDFTGVYVSKLIK